MRRPRFISETASAYSYACTLMMGIGSLLWGYDSGIFGTAQAQVYFTEQFKTNAQTLGAVVSTYPAGGAVGCLLSMPIGNYFGRRNTIRIGAVVSIIGTTFQTAAFNVPLLIVGRIIAGLAIGIIYFAIPMYMSELAPAEHRGLFVGLHAQFIGFGYALSNWIGFAVYFSSGAFTFRFPVGLQIVLGVILLACAFYIPESPRWLIEEGKMESALALMKRLRREGTSDELVHKEFTQMRDQITWEKENELSSLMGILRKPSYRKRLLLGCFSHIGQQISGISAINYYQTQMYRSLGIKGVTVLALASVWGITGPLANIFCLMFIIDRFNRRVVLMTGSLAMAADIAIVMAFVAVYGGGPNVAANGIGIFFLISFGIIFSLSWNSGTPLYCTEIFPTQIRATGGAIATFCSFVIQVVLAQASPSALQNIGWRYYFVFIVCNLVTAAIVYFFLPETRGKTLEEISEVFGDVFVAVHMNEPLKIELTENVTVAEHAEVITPKV
ncbi:general substrate transporter [Hyaloscypha finlandica]|nr:general substrate transporter [Hyaloscypha finlandica]